MLFLDNPRERIGGPTRDPHFYPNTTHKQHKSKSPISRPTLSAFKTQGPAELGKRSTRETKDNNGPDENRISCKVRNKKGEESIVKISPLPMAPLHSVKKVETPSLPDSGIQSSPLVTVGDMVKERWRVVRKIGGGGFGDIYEAADVNAPHNLVAIKVEPVPENSTAAGAACKQVLKMEVFVLKRLQGKPNFCKLYGCGRNERFSYLVMSLRGHNLAYLRRLRPRVAFTPATVANLGIQMLVAIGDIHGAGFLHRDVKPSNFAIAAPGADPADRRLVYALDFGLARQYLDSYGNIRPPRSAAGFRGTVRYASVNAHSNRDLSRRDDVWSLFYVLVEFVMGYLPWRKVREKEQVGTMKETFDFPTLLNRYKNYELCLFHAHLLSLKSFYDVPDYEHLRSLLAKWRDRVGALPITPYDWESSDIVNDSPNPVLPTAKANNTNFESTNARSPLLQVGGPNESGMMVSYQQSFLPSTAKGAPNFSSTFVAIKPNKGNDADNLVHRQRVYGDGTYVKYGGNQEAASYLLNTRPRYNMSESFPQNYESLFPNIPRPKASSMPPDTKPSRRALVHFDKQVAQRRTSPERYPKLLAYNYVINNAWTSARVKCNLKYPASAPPFTLPRGESHFKLFEDLAPLNQAVSTRKDSTRQYLSPEDTAVHKHNVVPGPAAAFDSGKGDSSIHSASSFERPPQNRTPKPVLGTVPYSKRSKHRLRSSRHSSTDHIDEDVGPPVHHTRSQYPLEYLPSYANDDTKAIAEPGLYTCHGVTIAPPFPTSPTLGGEVDPFGVGEEGEEEVGIDLDWGLVTIDLYKPKRSSSLYKAKRKAGKPRTSTLTPSLEESPRPRPYTAFTFEPTRSYCKIPGSDLPPVPRNRTRSGGSIVAQRSLLFSKNESAGFEPTAPPPVTRNFNIQRSKSFVNPSTKKMSAPVPRSPHV